MERWTNRLRVKLMDRLRIKSICILIGRLIERFGLIYNSFISINL